MELFHRSISAKEAEGLLVEKSSDENFFILDIRTAAEFAVGNIPGAKNVDFYSSDFSLKLDALDKEKTYLIYCRSGSRSKVALEMMKQLGFQKVYELDGGIISL